MKLFLRSYGTDRNAGPGDAGPRPPHAAPLVILHGLFGSGSNWQTAAKELSKERAVVAPDLRNHGRSPWSNEAGFEPMTEDLAELHREVSRETGIGAIPVLGHSLGGKIAMLFALEHPEAIERLVVVDIAPRRYPPYHERILTGLRSISPETLSSRAEADSLLAEDVPDAAERAFLLSNLTRASGGGYAWRFNLPALEAVYRELSDWPDRPYRPFGKPALFVRGGNSVYIVPEDEERIRGLFPAARIETVPGASHWVHAERPEEFLAAVRPFLRGGN